MSNLIKLNLDDGWVQDGNDPDNLKPTKIPIGLFKKHCQTIPTLRFNELTGLVEIDGVEQRSSELDRLYIRCEEKGWTIPKAAARDAMVAAAVEKDSYHPVREYLEYVETLPSPIGIDNIATTYLGTKKSIYDKMLRATLIAGCKRIFEVGCKFDYVTVLRGQQGVRKSTFWEVLSGGFFNSSMPSNLEKDFLMLINREWFYGLEELDQVTRKTLDGKLKNIISSQVDHYRAPYSSNTDKFPRSSIFVGTTNSDCFLTDSTGSRRFWIIECPHDYTNKGETIPTERLERDRDRIWCGAMKAYRDGAKPMLDWATEKESFIANNKFKDDHPFKFHALRYIQTYPLGISFTARDILKRDDFKKDGIAITEDYRQMGIVLKELGCVQAGRKQGQRHWKRPLDWSLDKVQ